LVAALDKIFIKDLSIRAIIGVNDWERTTPQEILINVVLFTSLSKPGRTDRLEDTISYSLVAQKIARHVEITQRMTVEALATDIAKICLLEPNVAQVEVRVEKPGALHFTRSVGVEIVRTPQDFSST
jgi:FolB domain-containing protein